MVAKVYHAKVPTWGAPSHPAWPDEYTLVATIVKCPHLDLAFHYTNHGATDNGSWWNNPNVERHGPETRSTSVGDVVVFDGTPYRCELIGWTKLDEVTP